MATTLSYTYSAFVPFTKISSSVVNQCFTDLKNRINWDTTTSLTGLGDDNMQRNTVAGLGLTRATVLKKGTANFAVYNDGTGAMTESAALPFASGGTGLSVVPASQNVGDVFQVDSTKTTITLGAPVGIPSALRINLFYRFA